MHCFRLECHCDPVFDHCYATDSNLKNAHISMGGIAGLLNQLMAEVEFELLERKALEDPVKVQVTKHHGGSLIQEKQEALYSLEQVNRMLHSLKDFQGCLLEAQNFTTFMFPGLTLVEEDCSFKLKYLNHE